MRLAMASALTIVLTSYSIELLHLASSYLISFYMTSLSCKISMFLFAIFKFQKSILFIRCGHPQTIWYSCIPSKMANCDVSS